MATPTLGAAFTKAIEAGRNLGPRGMPVTLERVAHVFGDARIEVLGVRIPVVGAGLRGLRAGDQVAVSWQRGQPVAAIRHSARRSTPVTPSPRLTTGVVEELFRAARPDDGVFDVWFRNFDQCIPLRIDAHGVSPVGSPRWGPNNNWFYVTSFEPITFSPRWCVFRIDRDEGTTFPPGESIVDRISLAYCWTPADSSMALAQIAAANQVGDLAVPITFTLTPANPSTGPDAWGFAGMATKSWTGGANMKDVNLDTDGNLIITYFIRAEGDGRADIGPTTFIFQCDISGTVVADVRREVILFDTWSTGSGAYTTSALGAAQLSYNETDWLNLPFSDTIHSFTEGELHCVLPAVMLGQKFFAVPTLVTNGAVNGWVGWLMHEINNPIQTAWLGTGPSPPASTCTDPIPPPLRGLIAHPLDFGTPVTTKVLLPFETDSVLGFVARSTYGHVVWSRAISSVQEFRDLEAGFGGFPGFATSLTTGTTTQICDDLNPDMGDKNMLVLPTDFVYQLDNPQVAFAPEALVNYFVNAWAFDGGAVTPNFADAPEEDGPLSEFKALADIPDGVTHTTNLGPFDLQIVNAQSLDTAGAFMELP
jgi:hypothetical protein